MKYLITAILLFMFCAEGLAQKKVDSVFIQTSAICEMCKERIEYDLAYEKGVKSSDLNLENKVLMVTFNPKKTNAQKIRQRSA
jgi:cation transport ATPase